MPKSTRPIAACSLPLQPACAHLTRQRLFSFQNETCKRSGRMINTETEAEEGRQHFRGNKQETLGQHGASIAQALPLTANILGFSPRSTEPQLREESRWRTKATPRRTQV